ncbi:hydroxymethylbilane synthase [Microlunatus panaciterrae]|uniref:Hydroxymethylbilane synthase n=1 Tax=Microlunatus panaciterrae TaxID=400768 RepID=A0ABS2RI35_9ACTN|nr:hydroxymethylbilane synthase [Microlunatus panaciterrae]MBM7798383.1 hydroxymethylbilane synthase [Microlunatus panaciterrae]
MRPIRIGARTSPLARAQADHVAALLRRAGATTTFVGITTRGDTDRRHLTEIGGTGVFAQAVREALLDGSIDVAVHSLKDLPTAPVEGLSVAAVPAREDTRDVLVGCPLGELRDGARIGTGAPRRELQLGDYGRERGLRLDIRPIRGNVDTRLNLVRSGELNAVVLAAAGLRRLGHLAPTADGSTVVEVAGLRAELLSPEVMLPAPGQGALALEISNSLSRDVAGLVATLEDPTARAETIAERAFLATLEAGCTSPVGARAIVKSVRGTSLDLTLAAVIGRTLGSNITEPVDLARSIRVRASEVDANPLALGTELAREALREFQQDEFEQDQARP